MNELVSIIVPAYNAEKFLKRSIEAILNQTYRNIELILINDGSTDNTEQICLEYAAKDSRVKYFQQENHGQGYTRARGIRESKGEYIAFVDADDYMHPQAYEIMLKSLLRDSTDVCVCQWNYELIDGRHTINNRIYDDTFYGIKTGTEFARYLYCYKDTENGGYGYANGLVVSPWNKLYRKQLLTSFTSSGYIGEDEEMNDYVLSQKDTRVSIIKDELYYWCENPDSITHQVFSDKRWHLFKMLEKRSKLYKDKYIQKETHKLIFNIYIEYYFKSRSTISSQEVPPPNLQSTHLEEVA